MKTLSLVQAGALLVLAMASGYVGMFDTATVQNMR